MEGSKFCGHCRSNTEENYDVINSYGFVMGTSSYITDRKDFVYQMYLESTYMVLIDE